MSRLADEQRLFFDGVTSGAPSPDLVALVRSTTGLLATERLGIYAGMYRGRLIDALMADFPVLNRLLGEEAFIALAHEYVSASPSTHFSLSRFGARLPGWLAARRVSLPRPDAVALASLEWARAECFDEIDPRPLPPTVLADLAAEEAAGARLSMASHLRLLELDHDVLGLWRALQDDAPEPAPAPGRTSVVVFRRGFDVAHAPLSAPAAEALRRAIDGADLGTICAAFDGSPDALRLAVTELGAWLADGFVERV